MSANEPYSLADLPDRLPIFPLGGALLLPRAHLPLNIFEPRYLAMFNDALASDRLIGMVQPDSEEALALQDVPTARPSVYEIGCAGRITAFAETDDGRMLVTLTGVARFRIVEEHPTVMPYRLCTVDFSPFENDLERGLGEADVDRERLLAAFRRYLDANSLEADWEAVGRSSTETLVNSLAILCPYPPPEKQVLLEAESLGRRADILIALTEMHLAATDDGGARLQ